MCTLTYLPVENGFIFTHNRDERMDRPTSRNFQSRDLGDQRLYYPEDLEAHGTWIAFSDKEVAACLLNGGNIPHQRKPKYRKSRGLVVLESFEFNTVPDFVDQYTFDDIEPFTLLIKNGEGLFKIVHNEADTSWLQLNAQQPGIWSSTTLYTKAIRDKREQWFNTWLKANAFTSKGIRHFHSSAGEGDTENDLMMSRWGILKTLSITQIIAQKNKAKLHYQDFVQNSRNEIEVPFRAKDKS